MPQQDVFEVLLSAVCAVLLNGLKILQRPNGRTEATTGIVSLHERRVPGFKLVSKGFDLKYLIFTCIGRC